MSKNPTLHTDFTKIEVKVNSYPQMTSTVGTDTVDFVTTIKLSKPSAGMGKPMKMPKKRA